MQIRPIGERVLIRTIQQEERTASGIYLPESAREGKKEGIVEAVGEKDGKPLPLKKGERILYGGYSADEFEMDGTTFIILEYKDLLATIGGTK